MRLSKLTENMIRQYASDQSFQRGLKYYENDSVINLVQRGDMFEAEVEGNQYDPYRVRVRFETGKGIDANCDCLYDWGGWCKHIVAVLLTSLRVPDSIEQKEPLKTMLADLEQPHLLALVLQLVEHNPSLIDQVEGLLTVMQAGLQGTDTDEKAPYTRKTQLDPDPFRRQVRDALHSLDHMRSSEAYWHVNSVVDEISRILEQAWGFVKGGDGRSALVILEVITDEYIRGWTYLDDSDGFAGEFFGDLGRVWIEAILSSDLTVEEGTIWADKLMVWQNEVDDYGIDGEFDAAQAAALRGWNGPEMQNASPWYADDLITAQLNVLEYQERYQEFLDLAKSKGEVARYLTVLVRLSRISEAVEYGRDNLKSAEGAMSFVQALFDAGEVTIAFEAAERGLVMPGTVYPLAEWLRDQAIQHHQPQLALRAAIIAFKKNVELVNYLQVNNLAVERWAEIRLELLEHLAQFEGWRAASEKVDIYLHEKMLPEAMRIVDTETLYYDTIERVVEAVILEHPDWAIRHSIDQAERIMDAAKAKHYHHAVKWLEKAGAAYQAAALEDEWQAYLKKLIAKHARKYKLKPMLEALR